MYLVLGVELDGEFSPGHQRTQALSSRQSRAAEHLAASGGSPHLTGGSFQGKTSSSLQMARPQQVALALPEREGRYLSPGR